MRDKKRIKKILKELEKIWESNSNLRLGQLILNLGDVYYLEDDLLVESLKLFMIKKRGSNG
jgi:uncharacterized protein YihD (DUF1040 family)